MPEGGSIPVWRLSSDRESVPRDGVLPVAPSGLANVNELQDRKADAVPSIRNVRPIFRPPLLAIRTVPTVFAAVVPAVFAAVWCLTAVSLCVAEEASSGQLVAPETPRFVKPADPAEDELQIPSELLQTIHDRSKGILPVESEAYFFILDRARRVANTPAAFQAAKQLEQDRRATVPSYAKLPDDEFPVFADLFQHPDVYRGRLVTLRGYVRRLISYAAPENDLGIETLYEAWLYTPDSQGNPAVVVCTEIPEGIPRGDQLVDHVSVTGYSFKHYLYSAQDTWRVAPMILAGRLNWNPAASEQRSGIPIGYLISGVLALLGVLAAVIWMNFRTERNLRQLRQSHDDLAPPVFPQESADSKDSVSPADDSNSTASTDGGPGETKST